MTRPGRWTSSSCSWTSTPAPVVELPRPPCWRPSSGPVRRWMPSAWPSTSPRPWSPARPRLRRWASSALPPSVSTASTSLASWWRAPATAAAKPVPATAASLSYRDVEEPLTERGIEVDHVTIYRWMQRFTPLLAEAARPCRHTVGDRWQVVETHVKVGGQWRYVYRAIDQFSQVVDVFVSRRRDVRAARRFLERPSARPRADLSRWSPIKRRPTRSCWVSCCRRAGIVAIGMPTTGSRQIMGA
jgi:DDE domain